MKQTLSDLAFVGGYSEFDAPLHVGQINLPPWERFVELFNDIFDRCYYTNNGPLVRKLDSQLAKYLGVKHAVSVCNGTVALMVAAKALDLKGEVILPAFTFVATAQAMSWAGLTPVFCDVDPETHTITPELVEPLITDSTSAVLGVHLWGRCCDVDGLQRLTEKHGLKLFFDAAHAFGCSAGGKLIGKNGHAEVFSLHATKICNALEGGFISTNDDEIGARLRTIRNFHHNEAKTIVPLRINGKMTEAQAGVALISLEKIDEYIEMNRVRYEMYRKEMAYIPGLRLIDFDSHEFSNYQYVIIQVNEALAGISRDELVRILESENILARRYFTPGVHKTAPYKKLYPHYFNRLVTTDRLSRELMQLPNGQGVSLEEVKRVCELIKFVQHNAKELPRKGKVFASKRCQ